MPSIELFDVQCGFGGMTPGDPVVVTAGDLVGEMARLQITSALVRTAPEDRDQDIPASTASLYAARAQHPQLLPCPAVVPNSRRLGSSMARSATPTAMAAEGLETRPKSPV